MRAIFLVRLHPTKPLPERRLGGAFEVLSQIAEGGTRSGAFRLSPRPDHRGKRSSQNLNDAADFRVLIENSRPYWLAVGTLQKEVRRAAVARATGLSTGVFGPWSRRGFGVLTFGDGQFSVPNSVKHLAHCCPHPPECSEWK